MAGIEKLQEIECLSAANLTENEAVGPMPESGFEEVADRHCRYAVLRLTSLEPYQIRLRHLNLRSILDQQDSFILGDKSSENIQ